MQTCVKRQEVASSYDAAGNGRPVMLEDIEDASEKPEPPAVHVVENWYEEFRDRQQDYGMHP
jgi:hypothetical protein